MIVQNQNIGEWDASQLAKFVLDLLSSNLNPKFGSIQADEITARSMLAVGDQFYAKQGSQGTYIGTTGAPAFTNSWVNYSASYQSAGYWKDILGYVHLTGLIKSGTVGNSAFTLTPGNRPPAAIYFPVISNASIGLVAVNPDGTVVPTTPSNNTYVSLNGIYFRTDT